MANKIVKQAFTSNIRPATGKCPHCKRTFTLRNGCLPGHVQIEGASKSRLCDGSSQVPDFR